MKDNATFYSFKGWSLSRKYYTIGRGYLSPQVFSGVHGAADRLKIILEQNEGRWPGLASDGSEYFLFVVGDEDVDHGWPLMFDPRNGAVYDESSKKDK
jgi:hypothetical protein